MSGRVHIKGFTLVELLVATTVGSFIALVAVGALKAMSDTAAVLDEKSGVSGEVRFAAMMIARDLTNLSRASDPNSRNLIGRVNESEMGLSSALVVQAINRAKARAGQPEADAYEVEYFLLKEGEKSTLMRRLWPHPDREKEPGGVLMPIADNIEVFEVRYFDGKDWTSEWPEKIESLPGLVEVTIGAKQPQKGEPTVETFMVNFVRWPGNRGGSGASAPAPGEGSPAEAGSGTSGPSGGGGGGGGGGGETGGGPSGQGTGPGPGGGSPGR